MTNENVLKVVQKFRIQDNTLAGFYLDEPVDGSPLTDSVFKLSGWVVGKASPVSSVEVLFFGGFSLKLPLNVERSAVAELFPDAEGSLMSGFCSMIPVDWVNYGSVLSITAVLEDGTRVQLATIQSEMASSAIGDEMGSFDSNIESSGAQHGEEPTAQLSKSKAIFETYRNNKSKRR